jgi:IS5 family transposase
MVGNPYVARESGHRSGCHQRSADVVGGDAPAGYQDLPAELAAVDALLDDPVFFAPYRPHFSERMSRPLIPIETYLRMMFLKHRYGLGYETLCREVADSISWTRFARIPLGTRVPHPSTLGKLTARCGVGVIDQLNTALLVKSGAARLVKTDKVRADTTVVEANLTYPTDSGLPVRAAPARSPRT